MKRFFIIAIVLLVAAAAWHYRFAAQKFFQKLPEMAKFRR